MEVYDIIRNAEGLIMDEDLREVVTKFHILYSNFFKEGETMRRISHIPIEMNRTAKFMAQYGLERMPSFALAPGLFGDLNTFLENDMGLGLPFGFEPNFGEGEVLDASPSCSPVQSVVNELSDPYLGMVVPAFIPQNGQFPPSSHQENVLPPFSVFNLQMVNNLNVNFSLNQKVIINIVNANEEDSNIGSYFNDISKGKDKVLQGYDFNNDGLLSQDAIKILDSGSLSAISDTFGKQEIDLEEQICEGVYAKDILHAAVIGKLDEILVKVNDQKNKGVEMVDSTQGKRKVEVGNVQPDTFDDHLVLDEVFLQMAMFEEWAMFQGNEV